MVRRFDVGYADDIDEENNGRFVKYEDYQKLEAENARLRQQRDAANAQLAFVLEKLSEE